MSTLEERVRALAQELAEFDDGFERYSYLVELAALLPPYPEKKRTEERLVKGCQSRVWLAPFEENGLFFFDADSDTLIIRGVLLLLQDLLNGLPLAEAANIPQDMLSAVGLQNELSDQRRRGIRETLRALQTAAGHMMSDKETERRTGMI